MIKPEKEEISQLTAATRRIIDVAMGRAEADLVLKNATYVNVFTDEFCTADIAIAEGRIAGIGDYSATNWQDLQGYVVIPGLIDPHIHLESSMAAPAEFAKAVLPHGTTTVVTDPHEITNVMGEDGIELMLQATENLPLNVFFGLPSCVPATPLDENGADVDYPAFAAYYEHERVVALAEMMNYPGVIGADPSVAERIATARAWGKVVDGHGPALRGAELNAYAGAGIYSDHECDSYEEAVEKLRLGQHVMIREGTAAHNLNSLLALIQPRFAHRVMLCTDDKHPNDLLDAGHIDHILRQLVANGVDPFLAVRVATLNPALYFGLKDRGALGAGYAADLVVLDNLRDFNVLEVFSNGQQVFDHRNGVADFPKPFVSQRLLDRAYNTFRMATLTAADFAGSRERGVLGIKPGSLVTDDCGLAQEISTEEDVLRIAVVERHRNTGHIGLGFIKGYGLQQGAVATSVSHDSHNLIVVGADETDMALAANHVASLHGGIAVVKDGNVVADVALPIAGLMSDKPLAQVNTELEAAKAAAFGLGVSAGVDPFMSLSFMSLSVIPTLRITTRGVFNVETQAFV